MSDILKRLNEIEARANAATKGPWELWNANSHCVVAEDEDGFKHDLWAFHNPANFAFIAHARTDIPLLLAVAKCAARLVPVAIRLLNEAWAAGLSARELENMVVDLENALWAVTKEAGNE